MKNYRLLIAVLLFIAATGAYAAGNADSQPAASKPLVAVSILPQQYFVKRIAGDRFDVLVLVGQGQSPHSYDPTPRQMADLARASLWILSGTDFEEGLQPKIAKQFPSLVQVDGTRGVTFRLMEGHDHHDEEGEDHDDGHSKKDASADHDQPGSIDRHTWLGREPALILAAHVRVALTKIDPAGAAQYAANYDSLTAEINAVFAKLSKDLAPLAGSEVLVFHPSFGYFLDEFGIGQESVETGGKEPTPRVLTELIARAREENTRAIFVQKQFPVSAAERIAREVGARVVYLDPLSPDWLSNIELMGNELSKALQ